LRLNDHQSFQVIAGDPPKDFTVKSTLEEIVIGPITIYNSSNSKIK